MVRWNLVRSGAAGSGADWGRHHMIHSHGQTPLQALIAPLAACSTTGVLFHWHNLRDFVTLTIGSVSLGIL